MCMYMCMYMCVYIDRGLRGRGQRVWVKLEFAQGCSWIWGMKGLKAIWDPKSLNETYWILMKLFEPHWLKLSQSTFQLQHLGLWATLQKVAICDEPFTLKFGCKSETQWVSSSFKTTRIEVKGRLLLLAQMPLSLWASGFTRSEFDQLMYSSGSCSFAGLPNLRNEWFRRRWDTRIACAILACKNYC